MPTMLCSKRDGHDTKGGFKIDGGSTRLISSAYMALVLVLSLLVLAIICTPGGSAADSLARASNGVRCPGPDASDYRDVRGRRRRPSNRRTGNQVFCLKDWHVIYFPFR